MLNKLKLYQKRDLALNILLTAVLIVTFGWLYWSHLGFSSLESYDEAWYGSIARNLLSSSSWLYLTYNGQVFTDHPPFGYWLMAVSYLIWGVNEFSTRCVAATLGVGSLLIIFGLGKKMVNSIAGFGAAIMVGTSLWFVLRARSGNLDIPMLFFYLLSLYAATKSRGNLKWLIIMTFAIAAAALTKALVGLTVIPVCLVIIFTKWQSKQSLLKTIGAVLASLVGVGVLMLPWYILMMQDDPRFLYHHVVEIGLRGRSTQALIEFNFQEVALYLQSGMGKWFKLWLITLPGLLFTPASRRLTLVWLGTWLAVIGIPLITTTNTGVWHLIPLYPPLALLTISNIVSLVETAARVGRKVFPASLLIQLSFLPSLVVSALIFTIAFPQARAVAKLVIPPQPVQADEAKIARESRLYPGTLYLLEWAGPTTVFYAGEPVILINTSPKAQQIMSETLQQVATISSQRALFIAHHDRQTLLLEQNVPHQLLTRHGDYVLVSSIKNLNLSNKKE